MSEIKYINIEDDRFWDVLFDEACVEGGQANRIQKELEKIAIDEKEITRKPMQDIVERLEDEMMELRKVGCYLSAHQFKKAIDIVEKVGGINE